LDAVRAAFPKLRRADLDDVVHRFRQVQRHKAERHRSRLEWRRPGTVWAADFKERREPIEGRYRWILSVKDLSSRYQLAWLPVREATAEVVQATYARLFAEHGVPLVMKSDNGGAFRAGDTKRLLEAYRVFPLYSPKRCPKYNGGVERANGLLAGYQEAVANFRGRLAGPLFEDAETARRLANDLSRPRGWQGPTASELWSERQPLSPAQWSAFQATVEQHRAEVLAQWRFPAGEPLDHDAAAAVDRRAIRDALVAHELLAIHPRRRKRSRKDDHSVVGAVAEARSKGTIHVAQSVAPPMVGGASDLRPGLPGGVLHLYEEASYSANNSSASTKRSFVELTLTSSADRDTLVWLDIR
jgi:transposase InsO family protein